MSGCMPAIHQIGTWSDPPRADLDGCAHGDVVARQRESSWADELSCRDGPLDGGRARLVRRLLDSNQPGWMSDRQESG